MQRLQLLLQRLKVDMSDLLITPTELTSLLATQSVLVLDVRHDLFDHAAGRAAYVSGHIPGAVFLDHEAQLSGTQTGTNGRHPLPDRAAFGVLMQSIGLTTASQVVVYDAGNSTFASHVWWMLHWIGHRSVKVLDGGWQAWVAAQGQVEAGAGPTPSVVTASAQLPQANMHSVDANAVLANLNNPKFTVLDARDAARYRGEAEPIDPVAGHIPGALNRFNGLNLQADGRFKPANQLLEEFTALLQGVAPQDVVHQCGSGITACHNLFAMELAGLSGSKLYPGSWSEWCSDIRRPVATALGSA